MTGVAEEATCTTRHHMKLIVGSLKVCPENSFHAAQNVQSVSETIRPLLPIQVHLFQNSRFTIVSVPMTPRRSKELLENCDFSRYASNILDFSRLCRQCFLRKPHLERFVRVQISLRRSARQPSSGIFVLAGCLRPPASFQAH